VSFQICPYVCWLTKFAPVRYIAAHSTVRALYANYTGPLYTVFQNSSNKSEDILVMKPGGFADVAQHESLCPKIGECVISRVVDQSGNGNDLAPRDDRGVPNHNKPGKYGIYHNPVDASKHKIYVGGNNTQVYGMYFDSGMGYKNNRTTGIATGDGTWIHTHCHHILTCAENTADPETMFAVMTGKRWGNGCCFDYGTFMLNFVFPMFRAVMFRTLTVFPR
jgi:hypothetical protein